MPVYFKGWKPREEIREGTPIIRKGKKRVYGKIGETGYWGAIDRKIKVIEASVSYPIMKMVQRMIRDGEKPVIVDWGCGKGTAISELARKNPKAKFYGVSDQFYPNWLRIKSAKFIHAPAEDFFRYFKNNSIDILYSSAAIEYLKEKLPDYVKMLLPKLRKSGVLALNLPQKQVIEINETVKNIKGIRTFVYDGAITILKM